MGEYNVIADADLDTDSPLDTDVLTALRDNLDHNQGHAIRCGTDAAGNRLAFAKWLEVLDSSGAAADEVFTGSVTFATESEDGNPGFSATPTMAFGFLEDKALGGGSYDDWDATAFIYGWCAVLTAVSSTGFSWRVQFNNDAGVDIGGYLTWFAFAPVTAGE